MATSVKKTPVRFSSLNTQVVQILSERINEGIYPPDSQLPPENSLAEEFSVSRTTIRYAFSILAERGLIQRRQGVGTFVSRRAPIINPLNQFIDIRRRIADHGMTPGFRELISELIPASAELAEQLGIEPGCEVLHNEKLFSANGEPAVYVINYIPSTVYGGQLSAREILQTDITDPFFVFFRDLCKRPILYYTSVIRAETASKCSIPDSVTLHDPHKAILISRDIGYDADEKPAYVSEEYLISNVIQLALVRRVEIYEPASSD